METSQITIGKRKYGVAYCYATELGFYKLTGTGVDKLDANNPEHSICLIIAAITAYANAKGEEPKISDKEIMEDAKPREILEAIKTVAKMRAKWYELPQSEIEKIEKLGEDGSKN